MTISAGVATLRGDQSPEQLLRAADWALYEAKRRGRDQVVEAVDAETPIAVGAGSALA